MLPGAVKHAVTRGEYAWGPGELTADSGGKFLPLIENPGVVLGAQSDAWPDTSTSASDSGIDLMLLQVEQLGNDICTNLDSGTVHKTACDI